MNDLLQDLTASYLTKTMCGFALFALIGLAGCGVQMKTTSLYNGVEPEPIPQKPERISLAVEPVLFDEDGEYFWVTDDTSCTTGYATNEVAHTGDMSLKIEWNRDPSICEWAGFGIGWDNWAGKDLSEIYPYTAFEMYVRTQEGKMFGLPMILTLEDYSGNMAWSYTSNSYFERYYLDEEWQRIVVPLSSFDLEEDGLNITNVKQLQFELQQAGAMFVDDVTLVWYEPRPKDIYQVVAPDTASMTLPITIFNDKFANNDGWGVHSDGCQAIATVSHPMRGQVIEASWDMSVEDCYRIEIGASWNHWYRTDMRSVASNSAIVFDLKATETSAKNITVGFEDYERARGMASAMEWIVPGSDSGDGWVQVRVPVSVLGSDSDLANVKQLVIKMDGKGECTIDNISIVNIGS